MEWNCHHFLTTAQPNKSYDKEMLPAIKPVSSSLILLPQVRITLFDIPWNHHFTSTHPSNHGLRQVFFQGSFTPIPAPLPKGKHYLCSHWFSQNAFSEIQVLPAVCSNIDVNTSISEGNKVTFALCNAMQKTSPQTRNKNANITQNHYHRPPAIWLSFENICSYFPTNGIKWLPKILLTYVDYSRDNGIKRVREKKMVPSPGVLHVKILWVTAKGLSHYRKKIHLFCKITLLGWLPKPFYLAEHKQSCLLRCYMAKPYRESLLIIFLKPIQGPL